MGYTIVYDRQFIKLEDGRIIPMILCGSNNCWERQWSGKERRERYWTPYWEQTVPAYTPDELMTRVTSCCSSGEYQEHFMRSGKWVDDAAYIRFFRNGIKEAKTLRELADERIYTGSIRAYLSIWTKIPDKEGWDQNHTTENSQYLRSDEEIVTFLNEAGERLKQKTSDESIYICLKYSENDPLPKVKRERKAKVRLTGEYFVITFGLGRYVVRYSVRR
jgi:hypothetical protein